MSSDDLREIFSYRETCISDTHDSLQCKRCCHVDSSTQEEIPIQRTKKSAQVGFPSEDQIRLWGHHTEKEDIIDDILKKCDRNDNISFIFELRVPPMDITTT